MLEREPAPERYENWLGQHSIEFVGVPVARRVVVWETSSRTGLSPYDGVIERECSTVFTLRHLPMGTAAVAEIRALATASDWAAALAMSRDQLAQDGYPERADFEAWRFGVYRADAALGRSRFLGAFAGSALVAFAGWYANEAYARFVTPITRPEFRRQGFFAALARAAAEETLRKHPRATIVIVAARGSEPERLYERLGFQAIGEQSAIIGAVCDTPPIRC